MHTTAKKTVRPQFFGEKLRIFPGWYRMKIGSVTRKAEMKSPVVTIKCFLYIVTA